MAPRVVPRGLGELRRSGAVTELLLLYACATREPTQLRPIARELDVTVQAVSHSFRQLADRGLAEVRDGRYLPTVEGVAWLHESLGRLAEDVAERVRQLRVVRSTRAVAGSALRSGDAVTLNLDDGVLVARRGRSGPSRGVAGAAAPRGGLVVVGQLEGIVPIPPAPVTVRTVSATDLADPRISARVRAALAADPRATVAAVGLEAYHLVRSASSRAVLRFAVAPACREASQLGVRSTVFVLDTDLPRLLAEFVDPSPPPLRVLPLGNHGTRPAR